MIRFETVLSDIKQVIELLFHIGIFILDIDFLHMGKDS